MRSGCLALTVLTVGMWQAWLQRQEGLQLESAVLTVWMWQAWLQRQEGLQRESGVLTVWMARGATRS